MRYRTDLGAAAAYLAPMPSTDPLSPSAIVERAPAIDASNGLPVHVRTAVVSVMACALAAALAMALLDALDAGGAALTVLVVPAGLGLVIVVIDFAWTPWQAAQAVRQPEAQDRMRELAAFVDTQASWRGPESSAMGQAPSPSQHGGGHGPNRPQNDCGDRPDPKLADLPEC